MMETKKVDKGTYRRQVDEIGSGTIPKLHVDFYSLFNHPKKIGKRY